MVPLHALVFCLFPVFFFNDTATTEIYTLSLHDALPITGVQPGVLDVAGETETADSRAGVGGGHRPDRSCSGRANRAGKLAQPLAQQVAAVAVITGKHLVAAITR